MNDQNSWFDTEYILRETSRILDAASKNTILNLDALQAEDEGGTGSNDNELVDDYANISSENLNTAELIAAESHYHDQTPIKTLEDTENVSSPWDWDTPSSKALDSLSASLNPKITVSHGTADDSGKKNNNNIMIISMQEKNTNNNLNFAGKHINVTDDTYREKLTSKRSKTRQKSKSLDFFGLSSSNNTDELDCESNSFGGIRLPHISIGYSLDGTFSFFDDIDDIDLNEDRILKQINDFNSRGNSFGPFNFSEIPSINTYSILNMHNNDEIAPRPPAATDKIDDEELGPDAASSVQNGYKYSMLKWLIRCIKAVVKVLLLIFYLLKYIVVESKNVVCDAVRNRQIDESDGRFRKILVSTIRSIIASKVFFIFTISASFILLYFMFLTV